MIEGDHALIYRSNPRQFTHSRPLSSLIIQSSTHHCCVALQIGVAQDALIPMQELQMLADTINTQRQDKGEEKNAHFVRIDSMFGHDSFLKEFDVLTKLVRHHLEKGLEQALAAEAVHSTGDNAP